MHVMLRRDVMKRLAMTAVAAATLAFSAEAGAQEKTRLIVYTALEAEQLDVYAQAFQADNPDIEIAWVRDSSGVIAARFLAEKDNPRADFFWSLSAMQLSRFKSMGLLEPYKPAGVDALKPNFLDPTEPYTITGMDAYLSAMVYNTIEGPKHGIAKPTSWADLLKPEAKGQIVMPHPASSGTGYVLVALWLTIFGEEGGWDYMDKLHENIATYVHSGSAPIKQSATGEYVIGLGYDGRAFVEIDNGAPIEIVLPSEGTGWDMEASAIVKGTKHLDAAKRLADWVVTQKANEIYAKYYPIVGHNAVKSSIPYYPDDVATTMANFDLAKLGDERDRILAEWSKRYEGKAAPKQ